MITKYLTALLCLCALTPACVPVVATMHSGAHGSIVDARTHRPLAGAEVSVNTAAGQPLASALSGADGAFSVPARRQAGIYIVGTDFRHVQDEVLVRRAGYQPKRQLLQPIVTVPFGPSVQELGTVALQPAAR